MAEQNTCTDLKKVNNLDELLYQIYTNLDSDCLFTMPLSELEEAWGIKIASRERLQPGQKMFELRESIDFDDKPYHSEADAFYVEADREDNRTKRFHILITNAYFQAHKTLFPEGNFPKLIPEPIYKFTPDDIFYPPEMADQPKRDYPRPQKPGVYMSDFNYYWLNADKTHMISTSTKSPYPLITRITVYDEISPRLRDGLF